MTYVQLIELLDRFVSLFQNENIPFVPENKKSQHLKQPPLTIFSVQENTYIQYFAVCLSSFSDDDGKEL
jgi:hypothetical protein